MHAPADGREPADGASPFPPAIRADVEPTAADPGASGELLEPFTGPAPVEATPEPMPDLAEADFDGDSIWDDELAIMPELVAEADDAFDTEPLAYAEEAPLLEPAEAPWEALGQAVDDALSRAAAAASPLDAAVSGDEQEAAVPVLELELDESEMESADFVEVIPADTEPAAPAAADQLAATLESLAARLRHEGPHALERAVRSGDRAEAVLAGVVAGLRDAGVFGPGVPAS